MGLFAFLYYYVMMHVVVFVLGFFDIIRIPHIPNWRQVWWTLSFELTEPNISFSYKLKLLFRQCKNLVTFTLMGPLWLLDEALFDYKNHKMPKMLFIICTPRTGSTNLHRIMAKDKRILAPTLTDLLLPIISVRKLGNLIGMPSLGPDLLDKIIMFLNGNWNDIHRFHDTGVSVVEELGTLTLSQWFNEMIMPPYFHPELLMHYPLETLPPYLKQRILDYAHTVIRKTAFAHADENPEMMVCKAIEPFLFDVDFLKKCFPDAKFVTLTRIPEKQITSRYSFYSAQQLTSHKYEMDPKVWGKLIAKRTAYAVEPIMKYFYREKRDYCLAMTFTEFVKDLDATYEKLYEFMGLYYKDTDFQETVKKEIEDHKKFKGNRKYTNVKFEDFCIDPEEFKEMFKEYVTYC